MKKLIVLSAFFAFGICNLFAQEGLHVGVKAIPQSTWMFNKSDSDNPDYRYRSTVRSAYGLDLDYHFTDGVGAGINLLFSAQGQKFDSQFGFYQSFRKLTFLKLPILLNFNSSSESVVMFKASFGPQFSFPIRGTYEEWEGNFRVLTDQDDIKDFYKTDIGMVFSLGMGFNITDYLQASLGFRFDAGFTAEDTDLTNTPAGDLVGFERYPDNNYLRGNTTQLTGGLEIGFKYILRMD